MSRRPAGDHGAYAILYGILLLAILGVAALVVDLGALRQDRRSTRSAADSAATAGAKNLDTVGGTANPQQACIDAWSYLATNLDFTPPSSNGCTAFPTTVTTCPSVAQSYTPVTVGDFTIAIEWPVTNSSSLMTNPNVQPGNVTQVLDADVDGSDPCARIGVTVSEVSHPAFAGIFGTGTVSTTTSSVAREINRIGSGGPIAALNILEPHDCDAVKTSGQGFIVVKPSTDGGAGVIAIESDGHQSGSSCPNSNPFVLDPASNSSGAYVRADSTTTQGGGVIEMWALQSSANPTQAYDPNIVPPTNTLLQPVPTVMGERFGDSPVRDVYDGSPSYIDQLKSAFGGSGTPIPYSGSPSPYASQTFKTVPGTDLPAFPANCKVTGDLLVPAGNWFVNCATLTVSGNLVFAGGNVVLGGNLDLSSNGCFGTNVPLPAAACPALNVAKTDLAFPPSSEAILYMRASSNLGSCKTPCLNKGAQASLFLARTMVYMAGSGQLSVGGGGSGTLFWTHPNPDTSACDDTCQAQRFGKIALWTDSVQDQGMGGQSDMVLHGVLFMPHAKFTYTGATSINQTNAQFWVLKLEVKGQSGLTMAPDPNGAIRRPEHATVLIR